MKQLIYDLTIKIHLMLLDFVLLHLIAMEKINQPFLYFWGPSERAVLVRFCVRNAYSLLCAHRYSFGD